MGKDPQSSGWDLSKDTWPVCRGVMALAGYLALGRLPPSLGLSFLLSLVKRGNLGRTHFESPEDKKVSMCQVVRTVLAHVVFNKC